MRILSFNNGTVTLASMHAKVDAWIPETKARP